MYTSNMTTTLVPKLVEQAVINRNNELIQITSSYWNNFGPKLRN